MTNTVLKMQHTSMQFSDRKGQQEHDVEKLFKKGKAFPIKTGTESGPETHLNAALKECAQDYGHVIQFAKGNWVAVDRAIAQKGSFKRGSVFVADSKELFGPGHDRVFPTLAFNHINPRVGRIAQAAVHYPTQGARPGQPNYDIVRQYDRKITEWMRKAGARSALAFVNGDFNINDKNLDWTKSGQWTSMGDQLERWPGTGHGPIDGFASYNKDTRVKPKRLVVLDDNEMKMFMDHFVCRATWNVKLLDSVFEPAK